MPKTHARFAHLAVIAATILAGCQVIGPAAIEKGRTDYNEIIQQTSMQQTLANIVRVYGHEPTLVFDVTEVDASMSFLGSITGGTTGIAAKPGTSGGTIAGQVGNLGGTLQYQDQPTIRYQPLVGQALVGQLATPISVDAIAQMTGSDWSVGPVLDLALFSLTFNPNDFYPALNVIEELYSYGALQIVATKSSLTGRTQNDSIVLYLMPYGALAAEESGDEAAFDREKRIALLWTRLLRIFLRSESSHDPVILNDKSAPESRTYRGELERLKTVAAEIECARFKDDDATKSGCVQAKAGLAHLDETIAKLRNWIELRDAPVNHATDVLGMSPAPVLRSHSAIAVLRSATQCPGQRVEFADPATAKCIASQSWNAPGSNGASWDYYLLWDGPSDQTNSCKPYSCPAVECSPPAASTSDSLVSPERRKVLGDVDKWLCEYHAHRDRDGGRMVVDAVSDDDADFVGDNQELGSRRRYMLIVKADKLPSLTPYVSYWYKGSWYYIAGDDEISKRNFLLISLFMTMMALPPTSPPLTPTISVGGH